MCQHHILTFSNKCFRNGTVHLTSLSLLRNRLKLRRQNWFRIIWVENRKSFINYFAGEASQCGRVNILLLALYWNAVLYVQFPAPHSTLFMANLLGLCDLYWGGALKKGHLGTQPGVLYFLNYYILTLWLETPHLFFNSWSILYNTNKTKYN